MRLARLAVICLSVGCGGAPLAATTVTEPVAVAEVAPVEEAPPAPDAPECTVPVATGPVPDLLIEAELAPVVIIDRRHRHRRVIQLEAMDGYGPLHVFLAPRGGDLGDLTDLGLGSDPRLLDDGSIGFLEHDWDLGTASFVRIASDGAITRTPGGNGRVGGFGGPPPGRISPFTRDGRFMAWLNVECGEGGPCHLDLFDRFPVGDETAPIESLPIEAVPPGGARPWLVAISEDGMRIGLCLEQLPTASVFDRTTREWSTVPIGSGRCAAFAPDLGSVIVANGSEDPAIRVAIPSGERQELRATMTTESQAAYDPCGTSVVILGLSSETTQRAERVFFDDRAPITLMEAPQDPHRFWSVEVDHRGWVLVASEDLSQYTTWIVAQGGGEVTERSIYVGARVFGITLGPAAGP